MRLHAPGLPPAARGEDLGARPPGKPPGRVGRAPTNALDPPERAPTRDALILGFRPIVHRERETATPAKA